MKKKAVPEAKLKYSCFGRTSKNGCGLVFLSGLAAHDFIILSVLDAKPSRFAYVQEIDWINGILRFTCVNTRGRGVQEFIEINVLR